MNIKETKVGITYNAYEPVTGRSHERISEESVQQAANDVFNAVSNLGYSTTLIPLRQSLSGFLYRIRTLKPDVIINLCEGFRGHPKLEAHIAGVYELLDIPFTGNSARTLAICQDKFKTKAILNSFGLPTVRGKLVTKVDGTLDLTYPLIVKPNSEDASLGIYADSIVNDKENLSKQIDKIITTYQQSALVEEYVEGREFNVAVKGLKEPTALPVSEIDFSTLPVDQPQICGYEAKWFEDHELFKCTVPICPAKIDSTLSATLQKTAIDAFQALECRDYARVDFRMNSVGKLFILEVNPNPDISRNAGYARALRAAGIDYQHYWQQLIDNALARKGHK